jgi:catechol 2,3-dioxygenase-like lactoylglutathione lyase family enzyme
MTGAPDPPAISVILIVSDAAAAISWYAAALGAGQLWDLGGVAALHINGAPFFVHEAVPDNKREPSPTDVGLTTTRIELFLDAPGELIQRGPGRGVGRAAVDGP